MRVSRVGVAMLRAHLRHRIFVMFVLHETSPVRRRMLLMAAFHVAVRRRFAGKTRAEVIRFVAQARIRRGPYGPNKLEPLLCERAIIEVLTGEPARLTPWQRMKNYILLNELVDDEHFSDAELEEFIAEAVRVASAWPEPRRHRRIP